MTVGGGNLATVSTTIALANKQRPPQATAEDNYTKKLRMLSTTHVILFDVRERRGWLVDGASALLHLLRKSLLIDHNIGMEPLHQHTEIEDEDQSDDGTQMTDAARSLGALRRHRDLEIYDNSPEITQETRTTKSSSGVVEEAQVMIRKQTWYRVRDRVDELYSDLEEIIGYQTDVESKSGIGFKVRLSPRRQLEGFDFLDLVSSASPSWPKAATLKSTGWGWVDFARALRAITLFGRGFRSAHSTD